MYSGTNESDQIVRLVLSGSVFLLRVSGAASMELLKFISAAASDESKASGKVRLKSLLQSGSELKVFTLQGDERFDAFKDAAKDYGVKYSVVKRRSDDKEAGIYDIMVRAEDASKINRIIEKYALVEVEASVTAKESDTKANHSNNADHKKKKITGNKDVSMEQVSEGSNTDDPGRNEDIGKDQNDRDLLEDPQFESVADIRDVLDKMLEPSAQLNPEEASEGEESQSGAYLRSNRRMHQPDKDRKSVMKELEELVNKAEEEKTNEQQSSMAEEAIQNLMKGMLAKGLIDKENSEENREAQSGR